MNAPRFANESLKSREWNNCSGTLPNVRFCLIDEHGTSRSFDRAPAHVCTLSPGTYKTCFTVKSKYMACHCTLLGVLEDFDRALGLLNVNWRGVFNFIKRPSCIRRAIVDRVNVKSRKPLRHSWVAKRENGTQRI